MVASTHPLAPRSKIYDLQLSEEVPTHGVTLKVPDEKQVSMADLGFSGGMLQYCAQYTRKNFATTPTSG